MHKYLNVKYENIHKVAEQLSSQYKKAHPFPYISIENFFNEETLGVVLEEFPDLSKKDTIAHNNAREIKFGSKGETFFGDETKKFMHYLNSEPFLNFLQKLTGIEEQLIPDPYFLGGGQHEIKKGGLLKIHADFNKHAWTSLDRRVNVLVYLNVNWKEEYGGYLELWDKEMSCCEAKILPKFNTLVIFSTTDFSFHGHPDALNCPDDRSRKSLALYYYSNGRPAEEINRNMHSHGTLFKARKDNKEDSKAFALSAYSLGDILVKFLPPFVIKLGKRILRR